MSTLERSSCREIELRIERSVWGLVAPLWKSAFRWSWEFGITVVNLVSLSWGGQVGLLASLGSMRFATTLWADSRCRGLVAWGGGEVGLGGHTIVE